MRDGPETTRKVKYGKSLRVSTLNVRSLFQATMQHQITEYMDKNKIDVMLLQETQVPQTTQYLSGGYQFTLFGSGAKREHAG
eukprot:8737225-Alexandrium_andersonii.AAC.1